MTSCHPAGTKGSLIVHLKRFMQMELMFGESPDPIGMTFWVKDNVKLLGEITLLKHES